MAKYKKRADGRYAKQVTVGKQDGKPVKKTVYGKTINELEKNYRELMLLVDRNIVLDTQGITFKQLREEWYKIKKKGKIRRNTELCYEARIKHMHSIDEIKVKNIKRYNIEILIAEIQQKGHSNTSKAVLGMLSSIFEYAVENDIIYKNPCKGLTVKHQYKTKRALTEEERELINKADLTLREKAFTYLLRYTGMRIGELLALRKSDIDKEEMTISISKTLINNKGKPYIQKLLKTDAGKRTVPIFLKLAKTLFDYIDTVDDYLFLNRNGRLMATSSTEKLFARVVKNTGIGEDITAHCFRHNFITECYYANVDVLKTQAWVGHSDIATTLGIYTHLDKEKLQDGEIMNGFYSSQKEVKAKSEEIHEPLKLVK